MPTNMYSTAYVASLPDAASGTYLPPNTREASYAIFPISIIVFFISIPYPPILRIRGSQKEIFLKHKNKDKVTNSCAHTLGYLIIHSGQ